MKIQYRLKEGALIGALSLLLLSACGSNDSSEFSDLDGPEITPEQMAEEMGVPNEPGSRTVKPADFGRYNLVVDVFRRSATLPPLGAFQSSYVDILTDAGSGTPAERLAKAQAEYKDLSAREFAVITVDGAPRKVQIISGALEGYAEGEMRRTPPGNFKLDIRRIRKKLPDGSTDLVDFPWIRSAKFHNSIMYWGLWIFGGYFIHSTTHYGELGRPASMGCIRQAYPDAMELFRLRQSRLGMIRIHPIGSQQAFNRLREVASPAWVLQELRGHREKIRQYIKYAGRSEIATVGHAWVDPIRGQPSAVNWPDCGPVDCFKIWGRTQPKD